MRRNPSRPTGPRRRRHYFGCLGFPPLLCRGSPQRTKGRGYRCSLARYSPSGPRSSIHAEPVEDRGPRALGLQCGGGLTRAEAGFSVAADRTAGAGRRHTLHLP
ncbi:uncharacterized protein BO66DRAFT_126152 [Aspergillus aculeatinus CBS 121060]|uniref:Uncharacterized protein n=1 Tax=Aspergillus aculeatinus CBS 121060 TaxID=1448322 RepID=A0ACD1H4F5_9EURO|nr:hypothetical protein BO66DRAFT_126152 [Aspergillus aculeatinus CBS 121060]RAH68501.1 hypothetical protein BO66DRAFT_126152 [Aspergillus aculeatinus CBS 121060]